MLLNHTSGIFDYSNTNYILAGMILQQATGTPPAELLARRITEPLHLRHTYLPIPGSVDSGQR